MDDRREPFCKCDNIPHPDVDNCARCAPENTSLSGPCNANITTGQILKILDANVDRRVGDLTEQECRRVAFLLLCIRVENEHSERTAKTLISATKAAIHARSCDHPTWSYDADCDGLVCDSCSRRLCD